MDWRQKKNGHPFDNNIFKCIFLNLNVFVLTEISQKFVPTVLIDNESSLVSVTVCCCVGVKLLPKPMMTQFTVENIYTYIYYMCVYLMEFGVNCIQSCYNNMVYIVQSTVKPLI